MSGLPGSRLAQQSGFIRVDQNGWTSPNSSPLAAICVLCWARCFRDLLTEALSRSIGQISIRSTVLRDFINIRSLYCNSRQWGKNPDVKVLT